MTVDTSDEDRYGRLLRYLWGDEGSINEELVRRGLAVAVRYPPDTAMAERFEAAGAEAESARRGVWAPDACGPVAGGAIVVADIAFDPPGADDGHLDGEWIALRNVTSSMLDLTGWSLKDGSASHRYRFPDDFVLAAGAIVRVHSGCGVDDSTDLHWCEGSAIWNNDGDVAFVIDRSGAVVATYRYG